MLEQQTHRIERINQLILREITNIISYKVKNPQLKNIRITEVITSKDLSYSKIFFTIDEKKENITQLLEKASGFFRSSLAKNLTLRHTPKLQFKYDDSQNTANKIEKLLKQLQ